MRRSRWLILAGVAAVATVAAALADLIRQGDTPNLLKFGPFQAMGVAGGILTFCAGIALYLDAGLRARVNAWLASKAVKALPVNVGFAAAGLLLSLGLAELGARAILPQPEFDPRLPFYPYRDEIWHYDLRGANPVVHRTTNEWGFRGDAPPENWDETYTIVAVGGSTTVGYFLDDSEMWTALAQARLRETHGEAIWVGNAGLIGHTTRGNILVMDKVIREVEPDAVIMLVGINDLALSMSEHQTDFDEERKPLLFESQLYRYLWTVERVASDRAVVIEDRQESFSPTPVEAEELSPLPDDPSEILPTLPEYRQNLIRIIEIADEIDTELLFLTQPLLFDDTPEWERFQGADYWITDQRIIVSAADFSQLLDEFNRELLNVCREQEVACYDLAAEIPHDRVYFYDSAHFTEVGAQRVGDLVAKAVGSYLLNDVRDANGRE